MFPFQVDLLIEAFGTNKQKRALSSRRLNQVGSETLQQAVAKAANTVIGEKGLEGKLHSGCLSSEKSERMFLFPCFFFLTFPLCTALQQEVADAESQGDLALHLPPCNANADKREDVYPFDERIFYSCAGGGMCLWK